MGWDNPTRGDSLCRFRLKAPGRGAGGLQTALGLPYVLSHHLTKALSIARSFLGSEALYHRREAAYLRRSAPHARARYEIRSEPKPFCRYGPVLRERSLAPTRSNGIRGTESPRIQTRRDPGRVRSPDETD